MAKRRCLAIVLAAGEGTRMRSDRPKVLHEVAGRTLLAHALVAVAAAGADAAVVVGPHGEAVAAEARRCRPGARIFVQADRRGTAHAVLQARAAIACGLDDILVIFGDTPLIGAATLRRLRGALARGAAVAVLAFRPADPAGYGRLIMQGRQVLAIREDKDANAEERAIARCNGGVMALGGGRALEILRRIGNRNAKGEFYLTDAVAIAHGMGLSTVALESEEDEVRGVNTRAQLAETEAVMQRRLRAAALAAGVTMVAPETVFLAADTKLARDVTIEPYVVFGPGVVVEEGATIRSFCHLEGARIGKGAAVGPFARLRPKTKIGAKARIGNFVEVKAVDVGPGAKANHLAYLGDGSVGAGANIGAGTIFCNYDGVAKHRTEVGKAAFVGSNAVLVAPVSIGAGAYLGAGSVITDDVPAEALAIARGRQVVKPGWARRSATTKSAKRGRAKR